MFGDVQNLSVNTVDLSETTKDAVILRYEKFRGEHEQLHHDVCLVCMTELSVSMGVYVHCHQIDSDQN